MKFQLFKKEKLENSADFGEMSVTLPNSKKEVTVEQAIEAADKLFNMHGYASDEHAVKVNDKEEMSVSQLKDCYNKMKNAEAERMAKEE